MSTFRLICPVLGSICPLLGSICLLLGSIYSLLGSIYPLLGSICQFSGYICPFLGYICPFLGYICPLLGSICPLLGSICPILGFDKFTKAWDRAQPRAVRSTARGCHTHTPICPSQYLSVASCLYNIKFQRPKSLKIAVCRGFVVAASRFTLKVGFSRQTDQSKAFSISRGIDISPCETEIFGFSGCVRGSGLAKFFSHHRKIGVTLENSLKSVQSLSYFSNSVFHG